MPNPEPCSSPCRRDGQTAASDPATPPDASHIPAPPCEPHIACREVIHPIGSQSISWRFLGIEKSSTHSFRLPRQELSGRFHHRCLPIVEQTR